VGAMLKRNLVQPSLR